MDIGNKRLIVGGIAAAGAMVAMASVVIGAGLAKADPIYNPDATGPFSGPRGDHSAGAYWTDITTGTDNWATGTVDDAGNLAHSVCRTLETGTSEGDLIAGMSHHDQHNVGDVTYVVHAAEWHFCPDKY